VGENGVGDAKKPRKKRRIILFANLFKGWNAFEYIMFILGLTMPMMFGLIFGSDPWFIVYATIACICSLLLAKGKIEGYFLILISAALYAVLAWQLSLFGEVAIQMFVVYPLAIIGIISWAKNRRISKIDGAVVVVGHVSWKEFAVVLVVIAALTYPIYLLLALFNTEFLILSTASLVLTMAFGYLMIRRSRKAMWFNLLGDFPTLAIWIWMLSLGNFLAVPMLVMEVIFIVQDTFGIFEWRNLKKRQRRGKRRKKVAVVAEELAQDIDKADKPVI